MPKSSACDRCHRYKERCIFDPRARTCQLCTQVKTDCTTTRARPRRGRRPQTRQYTNGAALAVWDATSLDLGTPEPARSRSPHDKQATESALTVALYKLVFNGKPGESSPQLTDEFYTCFDCFMLGPTFAGPLRMAAQKAFFCAPSLVQDIFPAIETAMRDARSDVPSPDDRTVTKGTVSLEKLRTVQVHDSGAALGMLALGQVLSAFDLLTNATGVMLILRYALASVAPWYDELSQDHTLDPTTTSSVFLDIVGSLVKSEVPIIKPRIRPDRSVDRLAGLCTTMLPLLYDLAVAINKIKIQREAGHAPDTSLLEKAEKAIYAWTPSHPPDFDTAYSIDEQIRMTAQASLHRSAALYLAQRARSPFGEAEADDRARKHAEQIVSDFTRYESMLGSTNHNSDNSAGLRHVGCPLLVAALEVPDISMSLVHDVDLLKVAPTCRMQMCVFVDYVWQRRNAGFRGFLYELVRDGPDFTPVP